MSVADGWYTEQQSVSARVMMTISRPAAGGQMRVVTLARALPACPISARLHVGAASLFYAISSCFMAGAEHPENPDTTERVLTVMLAEEY